MILFRFQECFFVVQVTISDHSFHFLFIFTVSHAIARIKIQKVSFTPGQNPGFPMSKNETTIRPRSWTRPGPGRKTKIPVGTRNRPRKNTGLNPAGPGAHPDWNFFQKMDLKIGFLRFWCRFWWISRRSMFRLFSIWNFTGGFKIGLSQTSALGSSNFHDILANWNGLFRHPSVPA